MIYTSCSIEEVIGRIIRNTRVQDTSYIADMHEWIPEAMDLMHTKQQYSPAYEDVTIKFHKGKLPCGMVYIKAVEYCGTRLPYGNSSRDITTGQRPQFNPELPSFISKVTKVETPSGNYIYSSTLEEVKNLPENSYEYYQTELNHILTSFADGMVRIHFEKTPTDSKGLPLIPDNANYKEAIYWYNRAKMVGAGYPDKVFSYQYCNDMFEMHAARAVAEIDYPSLDQMEQRVNVRASLIMPENYFSEFFRVTGPEQFKQNLL